jgi:hypothetical protein
MVEYSRNRNGWSAKAMVTSLRAFLRFAHATGRTAVPLAGAVPVVASWRLASLPRELAAAEIERLLAGSDRQTAAGLRDYAVLSLLARLGTQHLAASGGLVRSLSSRLSAGTVSARAFPCLRTQAADRTRATCTPGTAWPAIRAFRQAHPRDGHYRPGSDAVFYSRRFSGGSLAFAFPVPT